MYIFQDSAEMRKVSLGCGAGGQYIFQDSAEMQKVSLGCGAGGQNSTYSRILRKYGKYPWVSGLVAGPCAICG